MRDRPSRSVGIDCTGGTSAIQSNSPLLTLDQPLKSVAQSLGIKVLEV